MSGGQITSMYEGVRRLLSCLRLEIMHNATSYDDAIEENTDT